MTVFFKILNAMLALSLVIIILFPFDYLREVNKITPRQYDTVSISMLFLFSILLTLIEKVKKIGGRVNFIIAITLFLLMIIGDNYYRTVKQQRVSSLKILQVMPPKGIQAQLVTLKGLYFGSNGLGGKVILDGEPVYNVISWTDNSIVFEQPVPKGAGKDRFGWVDLYVLKTDGRISNTVKYEVLDPDIYLR